MRIGNNLIFLFLIASLIPCFSQTDIRISEIVLEGNTIYSDAELLKVIRSAPGQKFDQHRVNRDAQAISDYYQFQGYYNIRVAPTGFLTDDVPQIVVIFHIEEASEIEIDSLLLSGNSYVSANILRTALPAGPYSLSQLPSLLNRIQTYYNDLGFFFTSTELTGLEADSIGYTALVQIRENLPMQQRNYQFTGNTITRDHTLLKISRLEHYPVLSPEILEKAGDNISRKRYIRHCQIVPLQNDQLLISVIEDRMTSFSGILGYQNTDSDQKRLSGYLNIDLLNLFGTDRSLSLEWQRFMADRSRIWMGYHEAGPLHIPLAADFSLSREEADSTYITSCLSTDIFYYYAFSQYGLHFSRDSYYPGSRLPQLIERTDLFRSGIFWNFDNLDYYFNPTRGMLISLKYYTVFSCIAGKRIIKSASELSSQYLYKLPGRFVSSTKAELRLIENREITEFEYFRLGGIRNLRGFLDDQFSGYQTVYLSQELRYLLDRESRIFLFLDYGYVR
ncbi:MAG: BamA/TamA family outer membrane protein, partial [Candidatus Cloacimonetes bacterium]|nr:BamA/TamA family outer membrane protein [Candidatus Cloacimonadota bacterium]